MNTKLRVFRVFLQGALPPIAATAVMPSTVWAFVVLFCAATLSGLHSIAQLYAEVPKDQPTTTNETPLNP